MRIAKTFLYLFVLVLFLASCKENPGGSDDDCNGEPCLPPVPSQVTIVAPEANDTYWTDRAVPCVHNQPDYKDKTTWLVDGESATCNNGDLASNLDAGEHTITARISAEGESVESSTTFSVKEGFTVSLETPADGEQFFAGDEVSCSGTVTPESYSDELSITIDGRDCRDTPARLNNLGDFSVTATVTVDARTESAGTTITVKPAIAGTIYPLTDRGPAANAAGFTVRLFSPEESYQTSTDGTGRFRFVDVPPTIYEEDELMLTVDETADFFGARAYLVDSVNVSHPSPNPDWELIPAGERLEAILAADSLGFVLAPRRWQIRCGPYFGQATDIKLPEAFRRDRLGEPGSSFYRLARITGLKEVYHRWLPEDRPLPTAFNRADSEVPITAADSTSLWAEIELIESRLCRGDLLIPATIDEVPARLDGVHIRAKIAGTIATGGSSSDEHGRIKGGGMDLPIDNFGPKNGTAAHEMTQAIGFGETSEWTGVMTTGYIGPAFDSENHSVNDIVHMQLYMDAVDLQAARRTSFAIHAWRHVFDLPSLPDNWQYHQAKEVYKQ